MLTALLNIRRPLGRAWRGLGIFCLLTLGCVPAAPTPEVPTAATLPAASAVESEVDEVLDTTLRRRLLNTVDHGAWQILHGVLAYPQVFPVQVGKNGPIRATLEFALEGGEIRGWTFQPGDVLDAATGRRGLRALVEPGTKKGQGHADQWLAILSQANLAADQTMRVNGQDFRLQDLVDQVCRDLPYNAEREWSWTLIGLTKYYPTTHTWIASDGETWSIERLVQAEIEQDLNESACGGTHRLIGVATALNRHLAAGGQLTGVWAAANQTVQQAIRTVLEYQNPDGSFSALYFRRPSSSADLAIVLGTTGHLLEFLTVAMSDEQLRDPQVTYAVQHLCQLFRSTEQLPLECGALYHAAHGLVLYRQRMFGPRNYEYPIPPLDAGDEASAETSESFVRIKSAIKSAQWEVNRLLRAAAPSRPMLG